MICQNFQRMRRFTTHTLPVVTVGLALLTNFVAKADGSIVCRKSAGQIDLRKITNGQSVRVLGFANQNAITFLASENVLRNKGFIGSYNVKRQTVTRLFLSKWFYGYFLALSPNGQVLITSENAVDPSFTDVDPHHVTVISSTTFNVVSMKDVGSKNNLRGFLFLPGDNRHVILKMDSTLSNGTSSGYGQPRLVWVDLQTKKPYKDFYYSVANELDKLLVSPEKKYLLGLFYSDAFKPYGESDYAPLRDHFERHGLADVINPMTGKILWHLEGTDKQPVGDPLFFISPTRFISSDTVFDIATKTARHWNAVTPTRKCLAGVPNHANCALFLTPGGLQLRDWQKDKLLASWPGIKKPGRILFSPDLQMFSFKRGSLIQFWKFDPKWLR